MDIHNNEDEKDIKDHLRVLANSDWGRADDMEKLLQSMEE